MKFFQAGLLIAGSLATVLFFRGTWFNALVVTPLFFLLPIGVGLLILTWRNLTWLKKARWNHLHLLYFAGLLGFVIIGLIAQLTSLIYADARITFLLIFLCSLAGAFRSSQLWLPDQSSFPHLLRGCLIAVVLSFGTWWLYFAVFSQFPFTDLFAEVHTIKAANEYADVGVLNPFVTLAYMPFRPALLGALTAATGLDLLKSQWVLTALSPLYVAGGLFSLVAALFPETGLRRWAAFAFVALGTHNTINITNGSLSLLFTVVLLGFLIRGSRVKQEGLGPFVEWLGPPLAAVCALLVSFLANQDLVVTSLSIFIAALLSFLPRAGRFNSYHGTIFVVVLLITLIHRSGMLFVTLVVALWLLWVFFQNVVALSPRLLTPLSLVMVLLPSLGFLIAVLIAAFKFGYLDTTASVVKAYSVITKLVLMREINVGDELALGFGNDIGLIELMRFGGPLYFILVGASGLIWIASFWRTVDTLHPVRDKQELAVVIRLSWSWISGASLCLVCLSGFPFFYRCAPIALGCTSVAFVDLFFILLVDHPMRFKRIRWLAIGISCALLFAGIAVYGLMDGGGAPYSGYQQMFRPTVLLGLAGILGLAALVYVVSDASKQLVLFLVLLCSALALDRASFVARLKTYSYGPLLVGRDAISHYNDNDLEVAWRIKRERGGTILISDPYTLGLAKAITGFPGLYLFSNLDTVNPRLAADMKELIWLAVLPSRVGKDEAHAKACAFLTEYTRNLNAEALVRFRESKSLVVSGLVKRNRVESVEQPMPPVTDETAREILEEAKSGRSTSDQRDQLPRIGPILFIINPRTINWVKLGERERVGYFPPDKQLDQHVLRALEEPTLRKVEVIDGRTALFEVDCSFFQNAQ